MNTQTIGKGFLESIETQDPIKHFRKPFPLIFEENTITSIKNDATYSSTLNVPGELSFARRRTGNTEKIVEWWIGSVEEVYLNQGYFVARLLDFKRQIESIAEFDFADVLEDSTEANIYIYPGAEFAFSILTKHGSGSPTTEVILEFNTPHIWQVEDFKKAEEIYEELFPDDFKES